MQFKIDRDTFLKSLAHVQSVVEKKNTLPILGNVLIETKDDHIKISATDLDLVISEKIRAESIENGSTTTTASVLYDIVRKLNPGSNIHLAMQKNNRLKLISGKSDFNLTCLPVQEFPVLEDMMDDNYLEITASDLLKLLNKTKFSISSDETRHYLNGIYFDNKEKDKIISVSTDGHRLSKTSIIVKDSSKLQPVIVPKKTIFGLLSIIDDPNEKIQILSTKNKIKFLYKDIIFISKVIDGKFPDYEKVIPSDERKVIRTKVQDFIGAIDRVRSLSTDKKNAIKIIVENNIMKFQINDPTSGDGIDEIQAIFDGPRLEIGFNSNYLLDVANILESKEISIYVKDITSPIIIKDQKDNHSTYIVMPMRII
jgi:DNA polymerase-3 subunit beta